MPEGGTRGIEPSPRVLLCLDQCHGEFYLPLGWTNEPRCPNDPTHDVAVYSEIVVHRYCANCGTVLRLARAGYALCAECEREASEASG